ncbi:two-component hybrid sensor and regulator [Beggiatoa sp. PS]|nr:two-component hybrid sensor and regulator [Beggiatoa sp. PS]
MNGILGYAQILQNDDSLMVEQKDGLTVIQRGGEHLLTLINDILDLSKIEASKLELVFTDFDLPAFLQDIGRLFQLRAEQKDILFIYEPMSALPEGIHADEKRLRQILLNLLSNAMKFTHQGHVTLAVNYQSSLDSSKTGQLNFQIEDTGIGIAESDRDKIFHAFEQVGTESKMIEGTGLGLSITKKLIEMMGGQIQVTSELGKGSTFEFDIAVSEVTEFINLSTSTPRQIISFEGEVRHLLIADDKWQNRALLIDFLKPLGFEVQEAKNGLEALEKITEHCPDAILIDSVMPIMDGIELTQKLRNNPQYQKIPIMMISANVFSHHQQECLEAGCQAFLQKPINFEELLAVLATHLQIKWIYKETIPVSISPEVEINNELSLAIPSKTQIAELLNIARSGNVDGIITYAHKLLEQEEQLQPFLQQTLQLAENLQLKKLKNWLNQLNS